MDVQVCGAGLTREKKNMDAAAHIIKQTHTREKEKKKKNVAPKKKMVDSLQLRIYGNVVYVTFKVLHDEMKCRQISFEISKNAKGPLLPFENCAHMLFKLFKRKNSILKSLLRMI
jgi:hypothetical protein